MIRLRGKYQYTARYFYDGYCYYIDKRSDTILRCAKKNSTGCRAKIYFDNIDHLAAQEIQVIDEHNHEGDQLLSLKEDFLEELEAAARSSFDDLKAIYDRIKQKEVYHVLHPHITYHIFYKSKMRAARNQNVPPTPTSLANLAEILEEYPPLRGIFKGCANGMDNSTALIFIHDSMLEPLTRCTQLFCDGTFKIRPSRPRCAQVFIVHFRKLTSGFPAIFVLASAKTKEMYDAIWGKLFRVVPELQNNVTLVTSDFERAQINSVQAMFPNARISGCLFHYKQSLAKKWGKLNIVIDLEYILEKAYALAHLPEDKINEGMDIITRLIDNVFNANEEDGIKLQAFGTYLRTYWLPLKAIMSVFNKPVKTNNTCENFHLYALRGMGNRSNVYKMLHEMLKIMLNIQANFRRVEAGHRIAAERPFELTQADLAIARNEDDLTIGRQGFNIKNIP